MIAALAFAVAIAAGVAFMRAALPAGAAGPRWAVRLLYVSLGTGFGIGFTSVLFFILLAAGVSPWAVLGLDVAVLALAIWKAPRGGTAVSMTMQPSDAVPGFRWTWVLALALVVVLLIAGSGLIALVQAKPHGDWDAWSIWNLRAKFLAGPGDSWKHAFSPLLTRTHPEYPLLTSGWLAWVWKLEGSFPPAVPAISAVLFAAAALGLVVAFTAISRGAAAAFTAGMILLSGSAFVLQTASQYADIPLAFYYAAAVALILMGGARAWVLAGLFAGFAVWTKDEGAAFLACLLVAGAVVARRGVRKIALGAIPGVLVYIAFKAFAPPGEPIFRQGAGELAAKIVDFPRYAQIAKHALAQLLELGPLFAHPLLLLAIAVFALGWSVRQEDRRALLACALALGLTLASYLAVYVIVPQNLAWRLETSMARLYAHLWPALLLVVFMGLGNSDVPAETVLVGAARPSPPKRRRARQRVSDR